MNNNKHTLDEQIRAALSEHEATYQAAHWDKMSNQLDALDAAELDFDKSLAERLSSVSRVPQMGDWSKMSSMLDDLGDADTSFDNSMRDSLENINRRFQPNHWEMMSERIDRELTWRGKIVRYKVVEVALMLLLLFTVANTLDFVNRNSDDEVSIENGQSRIEKNKTATQPSKIAPAKLPIQQLKNVPTYMRRGLPSKAAPTQTPNNKPIAGIENSELRIENVDLKIQNTNLSKNAIAETNAILNSESTVTKTDNSQLTIHNSQPATQNSEITEGGVFGLKTDNQLTKVDSHVAAEIPSIANRSAAIAFEKLPLADANLLNNNALETLPQPTIALTEKKSRWSLSGMVSWATDWVTTPFIVNRELNKPRQIAPNAGIAAKIGYRRNKMEVETGIAYGTKSYELPVIDITTGSFANYRSTKVAENLRLSIVSIPLSINTTVLQKKRWEASVRFGSTLHGIAKIQDNRQFDNPNSNGQGPSNNNNYDSEINAYEKGLMQGGKWSNNTLLTANAGFGVEYRLTPRASVFVQPQVEMMLKKDGIGTLSDRIQTLNVQAGTKIRL